MKTNKKGRGLLVKLVGFSGKMTSGKTTLSELLVENYGFKRVAIGDGVKRVSNTLLENPGYLSEILGDSYNNKNVMNQFRDLSRKVQNLKFKKVNGIYVKNEAYRYLTQETGQILRNEYGNDVWLRKFLDQVEKSIVNGVKLVCDDIRMRSEYDVLSEKGFNIIRLDVDEKVQVNRIIKLYKTYSPEALKHKTEIELDLVKFDNRVNTSNDTVEDSFKKVCSILGI